MSFIGKENKGVTYAPGYFLSSEECTRKTMQMTTTMASAAVNGSFYVPMGTVYPSNDANAVGIVYEDVDVSTGAMPGSVVTKGAVYKNRLPVTLTSTAMGALIDKGFTFEDAAPTVTRPY